MVNAGDFREHEQMSVAARSTAVMPTPALRQCQAACARQHNTDYRRHP